MSGSGSVRTFAVFVDLPVHVELALPLMPLLLEDLVVHFDELRVPCPEGTGKHWSVRGPYRVVRVKLTYGSRRGLSQFVELAKVM